MNDRGGELEGKGGERRELTSVTVGEVADRMSCRMVVLAKKQLEIDNVEHFGHKAAREVIGFEEFLTEQARFQHDYALAVLLMPDGYLQNFGMKMRSGIDAVRNEGLRSVMESLLTGAVSMVTFVDLLRRNGFCCDPKRLKGMKVTVEDDIYGKCDLKLATGGAVFMVSLKTVAGGFDGEGMVQKVTAREEIVCCGRKVGVGEQGKMSDWIEQMRRERDSRDTRDIVPVVVFVPSNKLIAVDSETGRLNEEGGGELVKTWVERFAKGMSGVGFGLPVDMLR
jgi:hypothetical protein